MADRIGGALQQNLLSLLCFSEKSAHLVRNAVEPQLFSSDLYRKIVERVYEFLDAHKKPPKEHLPDLLEDVLTAKTSEAELCLLIVQEVLERHAEVNESYVVSSLDAFIRRQRLKITLIKASELVQDDDIESAEVELEKGLRRRLELFSPGLNLSQGWQKVIHGQVREDIVPTGVKELDKWDLGPARGELHLFVGPPKRGKSWWLINLGKRILMSRLKVCHITLELSEPQILQRYVQNIFSLMKHKAKVEVARLEQDELGRFTKFTREELRGRRAVTDPKLRKEIAERLSALRFHDNLIVKSFPTGMLSLNGLRAYLDALERTHHFIPDALVLDYPDLMKVNAKNKREELGQVFVDLRGLAVERNILLPVATQANRSGSEAKLVTDAHASEDYSKIMTADTVITYSQTLAEKDLGLARLFVSNTRVSDHDRFVALISQALQVGQFSLDSALMRDSYWGQVKEAVPGAGQE